MKKTIIFDLDGTLINLNLDFEELNSKILALLNLNKKSGPLLDTIIHETMNNKNLREKIWILVDKVELENIEQLEVFPETIAVLNDLQKQGYGLALVTLQGRKATQKILHKLEIFDFFNPIFTREDSHKRSRQIELVIKSLNIPKDQILMVGDRLNDVKASKEVDVNCILIRRSYNPLEGTIVIKSLSELHQYL